MSLSLIIDYYILLIYTYLYFNVHVDMETIVTGVSLILCCCRKAFFLPCSVGNHIHHTTWKNK